MKSFVRVLIADDENVFRNTLRNLFPWEEEGFLLVGFAENGKQALALLDATMPQIVITDIAMPVMDGIELLHEIEKRNRMPAYREHPIGSIVISGFETFSYVRDAMKAGAYDYILKSELTRDNLLERLHNLVSSMPQSARSDRLEFDQFCANLINRAYVSLPFLQRQLDSYGVGIDAQAPLFLMQSFCTDPSESPMQALDARRGLRQHLAGLPAAAVFVQEKCIVFGELPQLDAAMAAAEQLFDDCSALYWGICTQVNGVLDLPQAAARLVQIPKQYFYAPGRHVFRCVPDQPHEVPAPIAPAQLEQAVARSDYQRVSLLFGSFLSECAKANADPYAVRKNCENAVYLLILALERRQETAAPTAQKKIEFFQKIEAAASIDELCDILEDILSDLTSWAAPQAEGSRQLLEQIEQFIAENYMKPLYLSDLALHVHLSYHYLSRILKSAYNESFNDYLNRVRVDAACKLLKETDWNLARVAESVGFTDQSYFGKVFKKHTGLSPRLYRMQGRQHEGR